MSRLPALRRRLTREESGFTLPEVLVTCLILVVVLSALYGIFDQTIRIFAAGNERTNAVQNARVAMERMEREIRMAFPKDGRDSNGDGVMDNPVIFNTSSKGLVADSRSVLESGYYTDKTRITLGNDVNGDGRIGPVGDNPSESPNAIMDEIIVFWSSGGQLRRCYRCDGYQYTNPNPSPPLAYFGPTGSMQFEYYAGATRISAENPNDISAAEEATIDRVRIIVTVDTGRTGRPVAQTLTTDVSLRNRL